MTMTDHKLDPLYQLCVEAHSGTSFTPEVRGVSEVCRYRTLEAACLGKIEPLDQQEAARFKVALEAYFRRWMTAKARCLSSMITGPARFPVERQRKIWDAERKHGEAFYAFAGKVDQIVQRIQKQQHEKQLAEAGITELDLARQRMEQLQGEHAAMVAANKANRFQPPYQHFELTNSRARLKAAMDRVHQLEARELRKAQDIVEVRIPDKAVTVCLNHELDRLQLKFDEKPDAAMRGHLKGAAFKWAPSQEAWQRQLTTNAKLAAARVLGVEIETFLKQLQND